MTHAPNLVAKIYTVAWCNSAFKSVSIAWCAQIHVDLDIVSRFLPRLQCRSYDSSIVTAERAKLQNGCEQNFN